MEGYERAKPPKRNEANTYGIEYCPNQHIKANRQ